MNRRYLDRVYLREPVPANSYLAALPAGCAFAGRCERATARCREAIPPLLGDRQRAACFYSEFAEVTA